MWGFERGMWIKDWLGVLSILIGGVAYANYFHRIFTQKGMEPHPLSWFPWGLINLVAYLAQRSGHGGPGTWVTLFTACVCFVIALVTLLKFGLNASRGDWLCLSAALLVFSFYLGTKDPNSAAILATVTNTAIFAPTVMKGWRLPYSDSAGSFALNGIKFGLSVPALTSHTVATLLYPTTGVMLNLGVTAMLVMRRRAVPVAPSLVEAS